jgi:cell division protein ZapA
VAQSQDSVRMEIFDQDYYVKGDLDPHYLAVLAQYVDGKMRAIAARSHTVDTLRIAVLAALNIADEYHRLKSKFETTTQQAERKVGECNLALDELLKRAV